MPPIANYRFEPAIDRSYVHQLRSSHFSVAVRRRTSRLDGLLELCGVTRVSVLAWGDGVAHGVAHSALKLKQKIDGVSGHCIYMDKDSDSMGM